MKLWDLPQRAENRPRIFGLEPNGHKDGWVEFDHLDGMYSYCVAFDGEGNLLGPVHLQCGTPLEAVVTEQGMGFRIPSEEMQLRSVS